MKLAMSMLLVATVVPQDRHDQSERGRGYYRPPEVKVEVLDGLPWYTIRAQNASAETLVLKLAELSGRQLIGFETMERSSLVSVELVRRPIDQVLEYVLGSIGLDFELRRDAIDVFVPGESEAVDEVLELATVAWVRAATRFPDHPDAVFARLAQGEIAELRGLLGAARDHYLALIEDYPKSRLVAEAYMRAGRISSNLGQWSEASRHFRTLANLDVADDYHAPARLEWARTMVELGDPQAALHMLSALETNYPATSASEVTARKLVRARALNAREHYMEALQELDAAGADLDPLASWEALQIRAVALEGIGLPSEAARAWLVYAESAQGAEQAHALDQAARLSLEADDELATLFIVRRAETLGADANLARYEDEARRRLGFGTSDPQAASITERLERAEEWLDQSQFDRAAPALESLFLARGALDEQTSARVSVAWARCIDHGQGLDAAIRVLSQIRKGFESLDARRSIDVGAARLFEQYELFDRAVLAYEGRY